MLDTFLPAQDFQPELLKAWIMRNPKNERRIRFKEELRQIIDESAITMAEYEALTESEFENEEELKAHFNALWSYFYEDGPYPI